MQQREEGNHCGKLFRSEGFDVNKSLRKLLKGSFCDPHRSLLVDCSEDDEEDATTLASSRSRGLFSVSSDLMIEVYESPRHSSSDVNLKTPERVAQAEDSRDERTKASRNLSKSANSEQTFFTTGDMMITGIRIQEGDHATSRKSSLGLVTSLSSSTEQDSSTTEHNAVKSAPGNSTKMRNSIAISFLVLFCTGIVFLMLTKEWGYTGDFSLEGAKNQWIQQKEWVTTKLKESKLIAGQCVSPFMLSFVMYQLLQKQPKKKAQKKRKMKKMRK